LCKRGDLIMCIDSPFNERHCRGTGGLTHSVHVLESMYAHRFDPIRRHHEVTVRRPYLGCCSQCPLLRDTSTTTRGPIDHDNNVRQHLPSSCMRGVTVGNSVVKGVRLSSLAVLQSLCHYASRTASNDSRRLMHRSEFFLIVNGLGNFNCVLYFTCHFSYASPLSYTSRISPTPPFYFSG
jgi:hypothetical protein